MQVGKQVIDLIIIENHVERRHCATAHLDRLAYMFIGSRQPIGKIVFLEDPHQRRSLQRFFLVSVMTDRTVRLEDLASAPLLSGELMARARGIVMTADGDKKQKAKYRERKKWRDSFQAPILSSFVETQHRCVLAD